MKKTTLLSALSSRHLRFGGYATLIIVAAVAVVVALNVLVDQIPGKLDLTQNQLYSLSPATYKLLDALKTDVTITTIGKEGSEDSTVHEILLKYAARSKRIKLQTIDPELKPGWTKQYDPTGQGLGTGTLIVASGPRYKTVGYYDMYNYDTSNYDPTNPNSQPQLTSLSVEQKVTSALLFVTEAKNSTLAVLEGHGEQTLDSLGLTSTVSNENYAVQQLSLLNAQSVPADTDVLLILAPKVDLTTQDADKVRAYLAGGGRAVIMLDIMTKANELPNLDAILQTYGVEVRNVVVIEGDTSRIWSPSSPAAVIPSLGYHDILSPLRANNYPVALLAPQAIQTLELKKKTLKIEPLLTSSPRSYGKINNGKLSTLAKEGGDLPGPFDLAVAITDPAPDPSKQDTKLVVVGTVSFLSQQISGMTPGNGDFFMNAVAWLRGAKESVNISPKSLQTFRLTMSNLVALLLSGVVVILMPLLVLGGGFVVWVRRRHL